MSLDVPSLPDLALFGTRSVNVFFDSTAHGSGSFLYAAACTVGAAVASADVVAPGPVVSLAAPSSEPESEEQPAAISITGTAAAQTRRRLRRFARCWSLWSRCAG